MKKIIPYSFLLIVVCSCNVLKVNSNRTLSNTTSLGISVVDQEENFNSLLKEKLNTAIESYIQRFNTGKHRLQLHLKQNNDSDYVQINLQKGKIVSRGEKTAGYVISTIGLVALPIGLAASKADFIAGFYYIPYNKIYTGVSLSNSLAEYEGAEKKLRTNTGALFANSQNQVDKLIKKYIALLHNKIVDIEKQLISNK